MKQKYYICKHSGNIIAMIRDKDVPVCCCGEKMQELTPGTNESAVEKHILSDHQRQEGVLWQEKYWAGAGADPQSLMKSRVLMCNVPAIPAVVPAVRTGVNAYDSRSAPWIPICKMVFRSSGRVRLQPCRDLPPCVYGAGGKGQSFLHIFYMSFTHPWFLLKTNYGNIILKK